MYLTLTAAFLPSSLLSLSALILRALEPNEAGCAVRTPAAGALAEVLNEDSKPSSSRSESREKDEDDEELADDSEFEDNEEEEECPFKDGEAEPLSL